MPPNFGKVEGAYCPSIRLFKFLDRVLKFHRWIPHKKTDWIISLCGVMPLESKEECRFEADSRHRKTDRRQADFTA